jgi:hypothetical protein
MAKHKMIRETNPKSNKYKIKIKMGGSTNIKLKYFLKKSKVNLILNSVLYNDHAKWEAQLEKS